ncbi:MAG: PRC-barrel domain-containing protein [Candidatus Promineifilaceae bacterium]|nr:PRC-barrel domain-containing protein [Candidatus Promineifilaceae bacterium]
MQVKIGADVITENGEQVGRVDRVVIDPESKEVTHLVVEKGFLFTEDKVVPVSMIAPAAEAKITLKEDAGDLARLPDFEESHYVPAKKTTMSSGVTKIKSEDNLYYAYPPLGTLWSGSAIEAGTQAHHVEETRRNIPEDTIALKEGAKVISSDNEHVGDIERVFTSPFDDKVTHILLSQGFILKEEKLVPVSWIRNILESEVHLSIDSEYVQALPDFQSEE